MGRDFMVRHDEALLMSGGAPRPSQSSVSEFYEVFQVASCSTRLCLSPKGLELAQVHVSSPDIIGISGRLGVRRL